MKIVYCIDGLWKSGGTERVLTTKLNWLVQQPDIEAWVITLADERKPFFKLSEKVNHLRLNVIEGEIETYGHELTAALKELQPDVSVAVAGMAVETLYAVDDGSKKILEFHYTKNYLVNFVLGLHEVRLRSLHLIKMHWLQWRLARTARKYDRFVGLTAKDVELWGSPSNMTYVHNPLSFRSERKSTCHNKKIIAVGSFTPAKGMDQLINAFAKIAEQFPDWTVDIYGSGQDKQYLEQLIKENHLESQVKLCAPVRSIGDKLLEASIYAFPSRSDGFGLVITEAMECGLPTVAMDCPCGPQEIITTDTGIVVPEGNIEAFGRALDSLMSNESLRKSMGKNAAKKVERFYPDSIMPRWMEIFNNL